MRQSPLSFYDERKTPVDMLLLHCSAQNTDGMLEVLQQQGLSCHYIIDTDGSITSVVDETKRAWHGGLGSWGNITSDINSHSIGIELCHPTLGQSPYANKQIDALIELAQDIVRRFKIPQYNIVGHSDTAPTRKADPGKCFPWKTLAQKGLGLWYQTTTDKGEEKSIEEMLTGIGYDTTDLNAAQYAFCRHFLPNTIATDPDIMHLVDNIFPIGSNIHTPEFKQILYAVWRSYAVERLKG